MSVLPPKLELFDPAVIDDPYPVYARLRAQGSLARGGPGQWVVTRYHDVVPLMTDPRLSGHFSARHHLLSIGDGPASRLFHGIVLNADPPGHTRLRRLLGQALSPLMQGVTPLIERVVDEILPPLIDGRSFDAATDIGFPVPLQVLCQLVGIPPADRNEVGARALVVSRALVTFVPNDERAGIHEAAAWLLDYVGQLVALRRRRPGDDLVSRLLVAEDNGDRLDETEIIDNVVFTLFAGFETTTSLVASGCAALVDHPDQWQRLRREPGLMPLAVEELLRFDAPVQVKPRLVEEPVRIGDRTVRPGRVLVLLLGSANRDERQFPAPDRLDVGRRHNPHLSFGRGHHRCIGAPLARAEAQVVLSRLVAAFASLTSNGPRDRVVRAGFRAYRSVPVAGVAS